MSKISTYSLADTPLELSDRLIGTEAPRTPPTATPLATKNFSLGELLQLFSQNFPAATLQAVLDAGNIATQNITLTGNITSTVIKPTNIEDILGSQGTNFQFLSKATTGINWVNLPIDNLQAVLDAGNTATQNINLTGNITSTKIIPGNIQDYTTSIGTTGQVLTKSTSGIVWSNIPTSLTPGLNDVLSVGNTGTGKDITLTLEGDGLTNYGGVITLFDYTVGNVGNAAQIGPYGLSLSDNTGQTTIDRYSISQGDGSNSTYLQWASVASNAVVTIPNATGTIALTSDLTGFVTSVGATGPITSTGGTTPTISTQMHTDRLIGRTTAGTGTMEEISVGTGLTLSAGTLSAIPTGGGLEHGTATGTDTYAVTISGVTSYSDGDAYLIRFTNGNTTSATLNINSLGDIPLYRNNDGPLIGGDVLANGEMLCVYNSTSNIFQCIGVAPNTLLAYVTNDESVTITRGQAVYVSGGVGDRVKVKLAYNTADLTSAQTIGVVSTASIGPNQKGIIIVQGQLDNLSLFPTSTWADGDYIYLGATPGTITNVKPVAPNHLVYLGYVTTASNGSAGRMYVKVQNGYELQELHNVYINPATLANYDGIFYNSATSLWENKNISQVAPERRNANNSTNNNINYCGTADKGSAEASAVWTIERLTIGSGGSVTIGTATNVAWTNRESVIYT